MDIAIELQDQPGMPLYKQLSESFVTCINTGRLKAGDSLPSSRNLCRMLSLGRKTVIRAYAELESQGYIHTTTGRGTFISLRPAELVRKEAKIGSTVGSKRSVDNFYLSTYARHLNEMESVRPTLEIPEIGYGAPPAELLPLSQWRESLMRNVKRINTAASYCSDPLGYFPLREAVAAYLTRSRAVLCNADQVAIFPAQLHALHLLSTLFVDSGDTVAVENPGFPSARQTFAAQRAVIEPIALDSEGLVIRELERLDSRCKLVYVTPSHNDPLGTVMSMKRREQLLWWANRTGAIVIEDDYDCEYRYGGKALPSLFGLDGSESVIYFGTFWKILFPLSTVGFLVAPCSLMPTIARAKRLVEPALPMLEQYALTDFITNGHLERHIKRTRKVYEKRRHTLIYALTKHFGKAIVFAPASAGLHQIVSFNKDLSDEEISEYGARARIPMASTNPCYISGAPGREFMISFAHIDESNIDERVALFKALCAAV